jgi:selenide, water dikinase
MKQLVLLGAGHAHVEVIRLLGMRKPPDIAISLVSESDRAGYSGMMPGVMAGHYRRDEAEVNVPALCNTHGVRYVRAVAERIDGDEQCIHTSAGPIAFDVASINIGSQPWQAPRSPSARGLHLSVKPFAQFLDRLPELENTRTIAVIGGGAAAVEVLLALHYRMRAHAPRFTLVTSAPQILDGYPRAVVRKVERALQACDATMALSSKVLAIGDQGIELESGHTIACDASVWATGARPHACLAASNIALAPDGFILVDARQRCVSHPNIFAVGDCASRTDAPLQKSGVVPVRQGPWMVDELIAACAGQPTQAFVNKPTALALLSLGEKRAVGAKGNWIFSGAWAWRWKDYLDRSFMKKYSA